MASYSYNAKLSLDSFCAIFPLSESMQANVLFLWAMDPRKESASKYFYLATVAKCSIDARYPIFRLTLKWDASGKGLRVKGDQAGKDDGDMRRSRHYSGSQRQWESCFGALPTNGHGGPFSSQVVFHDNEEVSSFLFGYY